MNVLDTYSVKSFASETEAVVRSSSSESETLYSLKPLVQKLITTPNAVPVEAFVSRKDKFANNLLYRPEDRVFSIMGGNWLPGQTIPIHDHLTGQ